MPRNRGHILRRETLLLRFYWRFGAPHDESYWFLLGFIQSIWIKPWDVMGDDAGSIKTDVMDGSSTSLMSVVFLFGAV